MTTISSNERQGLTDFFRNFESEKLAECVAKIVSKNLLNPNNFQDAIEIILLHSSSVSSILNRKSVTKMYLLQYLNDRKVSVSSSEITKQILIDKLINYWSNIGNESINTTSLEEPSTQNLDTEHFPVHLFARKLTNWFFDMYNTLKLKENDFWIDVKCHIEIANNSQSSQQQQQQIEETTEGNLMTLQLLYRLQQQYSFYFNPNICHDGVQGRLDPHGIVLVLCCGTLHAQQQCVGLFECGIGLLRDPFTDNNWKIKHMAFRLKSIVTMTENQLAPSLNECESLQQWLALPNSQIDIDE